MAKTSAERSREYRARKQASEDEEYRRKNKEKCQRYRAKINQGSEEKKKHYRELARIRKLRWKLKHAELALQKKQVPNSPTDPKSMPIKQRQLSVRLPRR